MMKRFFPPLFAALLLLTSPAFAAPAPDPELAYEGDNAEEVAELRERIVEAEDAGKAPEETSGGAMTEAVRRFQRERGLAVDGVVGPETRAALMRRDDDTDSDKADTDESKADDTAGDKPDTDEPKADDAAGDKPDTDEPKADDADSDKPDTDEPKADDTAGDKPDTDEPKTDDAAGDKPDMDEPKADDTASDKPDTDEPKADDAASDKPDTDEPKADDTASDKPDTDEPKADDAEASAPNEEAEKGAGDERTAATDGTGDVPRGTPVWVEAVAYSPEGAGMGEYTVLGLPCGRGVIAVDPDFIPLGTRVYIPGYGEAVAADTGASIIGNIIDICFDTYDESAEFGRQEMEIYILEYPQ